MARKLKFIKGRMAPKRMLEAQSKARAAKKLAEEAERPMSIAKETVKGLPAAAKKVFGYPFSLVSKLKKEKVSKKKKIKKVRKVDSGLRPKKRRKKKIIPIRKRRPRRKPRKRV